MEDKNGSLWEETFKTYALKASKWPSKLFCMLILKLQRETGELVISLVSEYLKTQMAMYCLLTKPAGLFRPRMLPGVTYTWNKVLSCLQLQQSRLNNSESSFQSCTPKRTSCALKHWVSSKKQRQQLAQTDGGYPVAGSPSSRLSTLTRHHWAL